MISDNSCKPIGFLATLKSGKEVISVNASDYATTVATMDRGTGQVKTETFYGKNPLVSR